MDYSFTCKVNNLDETDTLAKAFKNSVSDLGAFVCMYGDIGAGKTAFCKLVGKHLGVKEKITSPSFVILNEYHSGSLKMYHFDLYRLEIEGIKSIFDELLEYSQPKMLTFIEWAQFFDIELPKNRIEINIKYVDETSRQFNFTAFNEETKHIIERLQNENFSI